MFAIIRQDVLRKDIYVKDWISGRRTFSVTRWLLFGIIPLYVRRVQISN